MAFKLDSLAVPDFAALAGFGLAIDGDEALRNHFFTFTAGHDEIDGLE